MPHQHRNMVAKLCCNTCEHAHFPHDKAGALGMCLQHPPAPFIIGMMPNPLQTKMETTDMVPVVRGYFPMISENDTCSCYSKRTEGVA